MSPFSPDHITRQPLSASDLTAACVMVVSGPTSSVVRLAHGTAVLPSLSKNAMAFGFLLYFAMLGIEIAQTVAHFRQSVKVF